MLQPKLDPPRGVLNLRAGEVLAGHWRYWPSADLAPFVEHYWTAEWDVAVPEVREVMPHPAAHLVIENGRAELAGVATQRFTRVVQGKGRVLSVKFWPGGLRPFLGRPVSDFTDRVLPMEAVFGAEWAGFGTQVLAQADRTAAMELLESALRRLQPRPDPMVEQCAAIARRIATDRDITRVEQVVAASGIPLRRLQRLFDDYVGVSPKWVIRRYRLHEAAERLSAAQPPDCADLAAELGYADQAHFIRDFKGLVGRSPAEYMKALHGVS